MACRMVKQYGINRTAFYLVTLVCFGNERQQRKFLVKVLVSSILNFSLIWLLGITVINFIDKIHSFDDLSYGGEPLPIQKFVSSFSSVNKQLSSPCVWSGCCIRESASSVRLNYRIISDGSLFAVRWNCRNAKLHYLFITFRIIVVQKQNNERRSY